MTLIEALRANGSQLCDMAADAIEDEKESNGRLRAEIDKLRVWLGDSEMTIARTALDDSRGKSVD